MTPISLKGNPLLPNDGRNVPCGHCVECLNNRRNQWTIRIQQELKVSNSATFLTLTYADENLPSNNDLKKNHIQKYFKRVRKETKELRYYCAGEYSPVGRPHYHAIVFNSNNKVLSDKWDLGFSTTDPVNDSTIHYVTKYIINEEVYDGHVKPFALMSKGLGRNYITTHCDYHNSTNVNSYIARGGQKNVLPRYFRDKIFTEEKRKLLGEANRLQAQLQQQKKSHEIIISEWDAKKIKASKSSKSTKC